jgi:D-sedoheptulose 7-phosphate isomerase
MSASTSHPAIAGYRAYSKALCAAIDAVPDEAFVAVTECLEKAFLDGRKVFVAGNGGSAATASHMACDFAKTTLGKAHETTKKRIRAIALSDNMPLITAWGNDVSYDEVFAQQLRNLADPGDVLVVITASGNSPNIVKALEAAKELGVETVGLLGFQGGKSKALVDHALVVESTDYGVIEDGHSVVMHMVTAHLRTKVLG